MSGKESQPCNSNADCQNGFQCLPSGFGTLKECVSQTTKRRAGAVCENDEQCESGKCLATPQGNQCGTGAGPGEECHQFGDCKNGFYCDIGGYTFKCIAQKNTGESCDKDYECLNGDCIFRLGGSDICN